LFDLPMVGITDRALLAEGPDPLSASTELADV
jgi:hypothetical protein